MIIAKTPFRVSLFGGGTDYPAWYQNHGGGAVLGMAIDKYCYHIVSPLPPFHDHRYRVVWSKIEKTLDVESIEHRAVRAALTSMDFLKDRLEITYSAAVPARTGLGTSSAFTVGLLNALLAYRRRQISRPELADLAIHLEQDVIGEAVGDQDQIWAAEGGCSYIEIQSDGRYSIIPLRTHTRQRLESCLMLFFTGFARDAAVVAAKQIANFGKKEQELLAIASIRDSVWANLQYDSNWTIEWLGDALHASWELKRSLADGVTNDTLDGIYRGALNAGALGGKVIGAGGGGCMLFVVPEERKPDMLRALFNLVYIPIKADLLGSRIILNGT